MRELASECAEVRLCSTPAVYAVACLASSQPAAIRVCTGSTIDLAREAIDDTTAALVEPPRCAGWEAAMLWAAAIASIATLLAVAAVHGARVATHVGGKRRKERRVREVRVFKSHPLARYTGCCRIDDVKES